MATCSHADRLIPLLHDNELQNPLRREMVAHMATCVTCARTFSLLEREQELFSHAVEEQVESIDFANFWQTVEIRLSDPPLSWATRLRLWYESWRPAWTFPMPAWAVAALMLLSFVLAHLYRNGTLFNNNLPPIASAPSDPSQNFSPPLAPELSPDVMKARHENLPAPPSIQRFAVNDHDHDSDNEAQIESIYSSGSGAVVIRVRRDRESNATVIFFGDGTNEYPQ